MKVIGVLGGLGPETTAEFYLRLIKLGTLSSRPAIIIWSLPLNLERESEYIKYGRSGPYYRELLQKGAKGLENAGAEIIVIPCNTVHEFYSDIVRFVNIPVVNLIEVVVKEAISRRWDSVLLLATNRTIDIQLYHSYFRNSGISILVPNVSDQEELSHLIDRLVNNRVDYNSDQHFLRTLVNKYGCDHVILGCTDLQLIFPPEIDFIDSMDVLAKFVSETHLKV